MKNTLGKTIVFPKGYSYLQVLTLFAVLMNTVNTFREVLSMVVSLVTFTTDDNPDFIQNPENYVTAEILTTEYTNIALNEVVSVSTFIRFFEGTEQTSIVSYLILSLAGKTLTNVENVWNGIAMTRLEGTVMITMFWVGLVNAMRTYDKALASQTVLDYVNSVIPTDLADGRIMLTVKGMVPLSRVQIDAIIVLLSQQYTEKGFVLTFDIPQWTGLVCFFKEPGVTADFLNSLLGQYTDFEPESSNAQWIINGHILSIEGGTNINTDNRADMLNRTINVSINEVLTA